MTALTYNGNGEWIAGIPARNLDQTDLDRLIADGLFISESALIEQLTSRGLYSIPAQIKKPKKADSPETIENEVTDNGV
jgi:hypothetical protein